MEFSSRMGRSFACLLLMVLLSLMSACGGEDGSEQSPGIEMRWALAEIASCGGEQIESVNSGYSQHTIPQDVSRIVFSVFSSENEDTPLHSQEVFVNDTCDLTEEAQISCVARAGGSYILYNIPTMKSMHLRAEAYGMWNGSEVLLYTADNYRVNVTEEQSDPATQAIPVSLFMKRVERITGGFNCLDPAVAGHAVTVLRDGRLLITGGVGSIQKDSCAAGMLNCDLAVGSKQVSIFDPTTGEFTAMNSLNKARAGHQAVLLADGTVLITGGASELYLRYTDDVPETADWPARRTVFEAPLDKIHATAEIYNPSASGSVTQTLDMNVRRMLHTLTPLDTDDPNSATWFLMAGGFGDADNARLNSLELVVFDLRVESTPRFILLTKTLLTPRAGHTATRLTDGRVLFYGGAEPDANDPKNSINAEIWESSNPAFFENLDTSQTLDNLAVTLEGISSLDEPSFGNYPHDWPNLHHHAAALVANRNAVLIAGGMEKSVLIPGTEKFEDATQGAIFLDFDNQSLLSLTMSAPRVLPTATALPSGRVVVAGGLYDLMLKQMSDSIDVLDLEEGTQLSPYYGLSDSALTLPVGRMWHSATLLNEGGVVWMGGIAADPQVTDTSSDPDQKQIVGGAVILMEEP